MPNTLTISQDLQLASAIPITALLLLLFWLIIYLIFEDKDDYFGETFFNGVDPSEMSSAKGVIDNIAAQSCWRCFTLMMMHGALVPAYPISAAALWAGGLLKWTSFTQDKVGNLLDWAGTIMTTLLFLIGVYESIWDDNNGVGIWHIFNSGVLLVMTCPRLLSKQETTAGHVLMGRPCYSELEAESDTTATGNTKEQEMTETSVGNSNDGTEEGGETTTDSSQQNEIV